MAIQLYVTEATAGEGAATPFPRVVTRTGRAVDLMQREPGGLVCADGAEVLFARTEFALLRVLVERRRAVSDADDAFVRWVDIAASLSFRSLAVDSENVRELVRRVRRKLALAGLADLIESRQGTGYRLSGTLQ